MELNLPFERERQSVLCVCMCSERCCRAQFIFFSTERSTEQKLRSASFVPSQLVLKSIVSRSLFGCNVSSPVCDPREIVKLLSNCEMHNLQQFCFVGDDNTFLCAKASILNLPALKGLTSICCVYLVQMENVRKTM